MIGGGGGNGLHGTEESHDQGAEEEWQSEVAEVLMSSQGQTAGKIHADGIEDLTDDVFDLVEVGTSHGVR
ncbi:MAG: hypothetical protein HQL31_13070, partial [Planctomycetes bacterium]|nr:hypothetical protein [Planctomycetota bacterium]